MGETPPREIARTAWARRLLILFGAVFAFTCGFNYSWNHWYVHGPLLLDTGWHSGVMYHRGWNPQTLLIEYPAQRAFFSFHLSPFMSFFGVLSTWFPGDRAMYYCVVQGLVYAPFGAAAAYMLPERVRAGEAALAMLSGVCVMSSGQLLACIGYPHLEPFVPAAITLMLAAMVRGRARAALVWLVVCATLREDAGFHAASFAFAALACNVTKRPFPLPTRTLLTLTATAFGISVAFFVAQKTLWPGPGLFREEYLGEPTFAHVTWAEMGHRMGDLWERCGFIYVPLAMTVVIAIVRRDPRYLLGWIVELPWLLINLFAKQPSKARFELYTGFPFIASAFWVLVYAHVDVLHGKPARFPVLRTWMPFLLVSIPSTIVAWRQGPWVPGVLESALVRLPTQRRAMEELANRLRANPNPTGHTRVDLAMAAWTTESMAPEQVLEGGRDALGLEGASEFYFFRNGFDSGLYPAWLAREPALAHCGALRGTQVRWCGRGPLPPDFDPMSPLLERAVVAPSVTRTVSGSIVLPKGDPGGDVVWLGFHRLTAGDYRATWSYDASGCSDAAVGGFDVWHGGTVIAQRRGLARASAASVTFRIGTVEKESDLQGWELRASQWPCAVTITDLRFVVDSPADVAQIADASVRATADVVRMTPFASWVSSVASRSGTRLDPAVATWAHASVPPDAAVSAAHGLAGASSVYFFREGANAQRMLGWLAHEPGLGNCSALPLTEMRVCGEGSQAEGLLPSSPFLERAVLGAARRTVSSALEVEPASAGATGPEMAVWGPFAVLLPGDYVATWSYRANGCAGNATGSFDVSHSSMRVAEGHPTATEHQVAVPFHVDATTTERWEFRAFRWPCAMTIEDLRVTPQAGGQIAPAHPL